MDEEVEVLQGEREQQVPCKFAEAGERRGKRRRADLPPVPCRWKAPGEQQSYSSRVLNALRRDAPPSAPIDTPARRRAVREAADRALAIASGARTRWSRAILSSCRALKLRKKRRAVGPPCTRRRKAPPPPPVVGADEEARETAKKVRALGSIVPGCRRLQLPSLLEEASDYIAALEMQVRAMSALAEVLSSRDGVSTSYDHRQIFPPAITCLNSKYRADPRRSHTPPPNLFSPQVPTSWQWASGGAVEGVPAGGGGGRVMTKGECVVADVHKTRSHKNKYSVS